MNFPLTKAQEASLQITLNFNRIIGGQMVAEYRALKNQIFNVRLATVPTPENPSGTIVGLISAAEILKALGGNAGAIMTVLQAKYDAAKAINADLLKEDDVLPAYTTNKDGIVTLTSIEN